MDAQQAVDNAIKGLQDVTRRKAVLLQRAIINANQGLNLACSERAIHNANQGLNFVQAKWDDPYGTRAIDNRPYIPLTLFLRL